MAEELQPVVVKRNDDHDVSNDYVNWRVKRTTGIAAGAAGAGGVTLVAALTIWSQLKGNVYTREEGVADKAAFAEEKRSNAEKFAEIASWRADMAKKIDENSKQTRDLIDQKNETLRKEMRDELRTVQKEIIDRQEETTTRIINSMDRRDNALKELMRESRMIQQQPIQRGR